MYLYSAITPVMAHFCLWVLSKTEDISKPDNRSSVCDESGLELTGTHKRMIFGTFPPLVKCILLLEISLLMRCDQHVFLVTFIFKIMYGDHASMFLTFQEGV